MAYYKIDEVKTLVITVEVPAAMYEKFTKKSIIALINNQLDREGLKTRLDDQGISYKEKTEDYVSLRADDGGIIYRFFRCSPVIIRDLTKVK